MSARNNPTAIIVGGEPRIDFLPAEIKAKKQARKSRRSLIALVIGVVLVCAGGYVFASSLAMQSQVRLAEEQARTQQLLQDQMQYVSARTAANQLAAAEDARMVGSATEIFWREYLAGVQATLPADVHITTFVVDSVSVLEAAPVLSVPLQEARVASLSLNAVSPGLAQIDQWLVNLRGVRGHADSTVTSITLGEDGIYTANVVLNVNTDAFEKRFFANYVPGQVTVAEPEGGDGTEAAAEGESAAEGEGE